MEQLKRVYRLVHEQCFLPIFTANEFDSKKLVEASIAAGCRAIEYTLRSPDAHTMVPWIREQWPDLCLLVGSTLDNDRFVSHGRKRHPQLLTIDELAAMGVDGFVSMVGFRAETLSRYSSTHLMISPVSTMLEMFTAIDAGAHFVKVAGDQLDLVSEFRGDATYDFCPIMVTGGLTLERIPLAVRAGAVLTGAGFELILKGFKPNVSTSQVAQTLELFLNASQNARHEKWPALSDARGWDFDKWAAALPHYHPFLNLAR